MHCYLDELEGCSTAYKDLQPTRCTDGNS